MIYQHKQDCYNLSEYHDMGATESLCYYSERGEEFDCSKCDKYLSYTDVRSIIEEHSTNKMFAEKLKKYIKAQINPYGKPFEGTTYEFGLKIMEQIELMLDITGAIEMEE